MARTVGRAGVSVRKMQARRHYLRWAMLAAVMLGALGVIGLSRYSVSHHPGYWGASALLAMIVALSKLERRSGKADRRLRKTARQAGQGAEGEEQVGAILSRLPDDHVVIHDLLGDYGNIDHVVVAPHGVFAIETKSHWGRLSCDGSTLLLNGRPLAKDAIAQTLRHAMWLKDRIEERTGLQVYVSGVLVFTRGFASTPLPKLRGVRITTAGHLLRAIAQPRGDEIPVDRIASAITPQPTAVPSRPIAGASPAPGP